MAGAGEPIGPLRRGGQGEQVAELLLSSQMNRPRAAQYPLPEDTAALKVRLAWITVRPRPLSPHHHGRVPAVASPASGGAAARVSGPARRYDALRVWYTVKMTPPGHRAMFRSA
jgi:hypothetical protein